MHRIDADGALGDLDASSKLNAEAEFVEELFRRGRETGEAWLSRHAKSVGHRATFDLAEAVRGLAPGS
jgi:hypothetical protein